MKIKWHILFFVLVIVCGVFIYRITTSDVEADLRIVYVGSEIVNVQSFSDYKKQVLEPIVRDSNKDKKQVASLTCKKAESSDDAVKMLNDLIKEDKYDIYISEKSVFEKIGKEPFEEIPEHNEVKNIKSGDVIYAQSIKENSILKQLGFMSTDNLYIAAAKVDNSIQRKNGYNITNHLLEQRNKYSY